MPGLPPAIDQGLHRLRPLAQHLRVDRQHIQDLPGYIPGGEEDPQTLRLLEAVGQRRIGEHRGDGAAAQGLGHPGGRNVALQGQGRAVEPMQFEGAVQQKNGQR